MKIQKISFALMGIIIVILVVASVVEKLVSTDFAVRYFYTAPWTIVLWLAAVVCAMISFFQCKMWKQPFTFLLHFSFVVILGGAMLTHLFGKEGRLNLRLNEQPTQTFLQQTDTAYSEAALPFAVKLTDFYIEYYQGTTAPMDFVSEVEIIDGENYSKGVISMNNILRYRGYRFYQSGYDSDGKGTSLSVSYDPWGIGVTYTGYALLLISILCFFFQRRTHFRELLRSSMVVALLFVCGSMQAQPKTLQRPLAATFGEMYVYYNDRVCPMTTLTRDMCLKIYGKPQYKDLTAEQIVTGWIFYYDQWAQEPMIKIKGNEVRHALGIDGKYACLNDFVNNQGYKLDALLKEGNKNAKAADEKFRLLSMIATGTIFRIYPITTTDSVSGQSQMRWYSWAEQYPHKLPFEDWQFVTGSINYITLCIDNGKYNAANEGFKKIIAWQERNAAKQLPPVRRVEAEHIFNRLNYTKPMAMACATFGLVVLLIFVILMSKQKYPARWLVVTLAAIMSAFWGILTYALSLRWIISGHIPLANGHETMQFLAWAAMLLTLVAVIVKLCKQRQSAFVELPFGFLVAGMTLMVSMMSESNPQITNLMPVLQSPLLSMHVAVIMVAYVLLAFTMLDGLVAIGLRFGGEKNMPQIEQLQRLSQLLLYPAVFCLTIGIFIGAVWANVSWGRYWGWDPKEVWALITMLIYSFAFHSRSVKVLQKPMFFHVYMVVAFLSVLFTYFGVNYILGGLHGYA